MRIIDAHMHVGLAGFDAENIIRAMDRKGVEQSWLLTWEEINPPLPGLHMDLSKKSVLEACARYPDRLVPFHAPDPASGNLEEQFGGFSQHGIMGCGELKVSMKWEDPLVESYLQLVQQHHLPLIFHMENPRMHYLQEREGFIQWVLERLLNDKYNGVSRYYISRFAEATGILNRKIKRNQVYFPGILCDFSFLERRIRQFPGVKFIGHGPDFWNNISAVQHPKYIHQKGTYGEFGIIDRLLEENDNLFCDISGTSGYNALNRDHHQARRFLQKHVSKILYGTDNTGFPLLDLLRQLGLEGVQLEMILYKNAQRTLE